MTRQEIMRILKCDYNAFTEKGLDIFGIFAFGSINYGTETENSDVDVKLISLSPFDISKTYFRGEKEGQIMIYSIEDFLKELSTGYHVWYEVLYTDYYIINPKYQQKWKTILELREQFVEDTLEKHLNAELACFMEQLLILSFGKGEREKENKRISHMLRLEDLINRLMKGERYPSVQKVSKEVGKKISRLKKQAPLSVEECQREAIKICDRAENTVENFLNNNKPLASMATFKKISQLMLSIKEEGSGTEV